MSEDFVTLKLPGSQWQAIVDFQSFPDPDVVLRDAALDALTCIERVDVSVPSELHEWRDAYGNKLADHVYQLLQRDPTRLSRQVWSLLRWLATEPLAALRVDEEMAEVYRDFLREEAAACEAEKQLADAVPWRLVLPLLRVLYDAYGREHSTFNALMAGLSDAKQAEVRSG